MKLFLLKTSAFRSRPQLFTYLERGIDIRSTVVRTKVAVLFFTFPLIEIIFVFYISRFPLFFF